MKRMMMIWAMMIAIATSASAMTYEQARRQALFLSDKMAYELNLTDDQYEAAYEINLDYLMSLNSRSQLYGSYWTRRNSLLETILAPWQYASYAAADYFFRPVYWASNALQWRIYSRYAPTRFYRSRPAAYISYRGGRHIGWYKNRQWNRPAPPANWHSDDVYRGRTGDYRRMEKEHRKIEKEVRKDRRDYDRRGWQGRW